MDKYQKQLLTPSNNRYQMVLCVNGVKHDYINFDCEDQSIVIRQNDDINITKYDLHLYPEHIESLCGVAVLENGQWKTIELEEHKILKGSTTYQVQTYKIDIDFQQPIKKVKLSFTDGIVDDCIFDFKYIESDKEVYKQMQAEKEVQKQKAVSAYLQSNAHIKHAVGNDLVNIYFQPCSREYDYTQIRLYISGQLIAKYKVEDGVYFKSITGLAFGSYEYDVSQFDKNGKELFCTEKIKFVLQSPNKRGNVVVI